MCNLAPLKTQLLGKILHYHLIRAHDTIIALSDRFGVMPTSPLLMEKPVTNFEGAFMFS